MKLTFNFLLGLLCISGTLGRQAKSIFDSQQFGLFLQQDNQQSSSEQETEQEALTLNIQTQNREIQGAAASNVEAKQVSFTLVKDEFYDYIEQLSQKAQDYGDYIVIRIEYEDGTVQTITDQDFDELLDQLNQIYDQMQEDQQVILDLEGFNIEYQIKDEDELHQQNAQQTQPETGSDKDTDHSVDQDGTNIKDFYQENTQTQQEIEDLQDISDNDSFKETSDQYIQRITEDADYDQQIQVHATGSTDQNLIGDTTSNQNSDGSSLTLVGPSQEAQSIQYSDLQDYDTDDGNLQLESIDSQNPDIHTFLQMQANPDNPLERDEDLLPETSDDPGEEAIDGETYWILVSSFTQTPGTGKIWQIPADEDEQDKSQLLLAGLQQPTGICFDKNADFLYVVDNGGDENGHIYQYEIDWDEDDYFILARELYVDVYEGPGPSDCSVDAYGNLFFVETDVNEIKMIGYLDLWAGFKNRHYTLYYYDEKTPVSKPVALDVVDSEDIYFINNENTDEFGLIIQAEAFTEYVNGELTEILKRDDYPGWGVAYSEDQALYYSVDNGNVYRIDPDEPDDDVVKSTDFFDEPRGICYGSDTVYVADHGFGAVFSFEDDDEQNVDPEPVVMIQGSYAMYCINEDQVR